jgi:phosphatidylglycerol---prolipoprotein diacylglyceryl transferase
MDRRRRGILLTDRKWWRATEGDRMYKVLFEWPALGFAVPSFGVALLVACVSSLSLAVWRARREGLDPEAVVGLAAWLMTGGFIGARLLYVLAHPESIRHWSDLVRFWQGGIVYYGCLIGGLVATVLYWRRRPFPFRAMADVVAPTLALDSALGRVGCSLNGCCHGAVSTASWAVAFPAGTLPWARHVEAGLIPADAPHSLPVHPAQLYAVADGILLLALLTVYFPRRRRDGEVMALLMVTYPVTRFLIEALRDDEPRNFLGLTLSQAISVGVFAAGLAVWAWLARQPLGRHADGAANSDRQDVEPHRVVVPELSLVDAGPA